MLNSLYLYIILYNFYSFKSIISTHSLSLIIVGNYFYVQKLRHYIRSLSPVLINLLLCKCFFANLKHLFLSPHSYASLRFEAHSHRCNINRSLTILLLLILRPPAGFPLSGGPPSQVYEKINNLIGNICNVSRAVHPLFKTLGEDCNLFEKTWHTFLYYFFNFLWPYRSRYCRLGFFVCEFDPTPLCVY